MPRLIILRNMYTGMCIKIYKTEKINFFYILLTRLYTYFIFCPNYVHKWWVLYTTDSKVDAWIENKTCDREVDIYEQSNRNRSGNDK